ncbi:MAG: LL-diaminopimelate aminotransferase [Lachnospiraceae bacterium]|nr:LL-diaminopimelate aminotransferase [Lachnospiraceae bacterium]
MAKVNTNFDNLVPSYLFAEIAKRVTDFTKENPDKPVIRLGIGDVTLPLAPIVIDAMKKGCDELGNKETFKGYPDYEGYLFAREAVANYYKSFGVEVDADEILINDGAKSDAGNITDIFSQDNIVLVPDPVYPVYVDTNIMGGRKIVYVNGTEENGFNPEPDSSVHADLIYLCSPNNPTGAAMNKSQLKAWVDYAIANNAIIFYDSAYEAFIEDPDIPRSIFAIEGARKCAIEMCSLSKTAGFTGTRCGYTVIPKELEMDGKNIYKLWYRRQSTKFNGVSYPVQCGLAAVFSEEGLKQIQENLSYYKENAKIIAKTLDELGISYTGGINSPYIWLKCPNGMGSWEFFDYLLNNVYVVGTPGEGFGEMGKGWFRLTAFGSRENTIEAMERFKKLLGK